MKSLGEAGAVMVLVGSAILMAIAIMEEKPAASIDWQGAKFNEYSDPPYRFPEGYVRPSTELPKPVVQPEETTEERRERMRAKLLPENLSTPLQTYGKK